LCGVFIHGILLNEVSGVKFQTSGVRLLQLKWPFSFPDAVYLYPLDPMIGT